MCHKALVSVRHSCNERLLDRMLLDFSFASKLSKLTERDWNEEFGSPERLLFHQLVIFIDEGLREDLCAVEKTVEKLGEFRL